MRMENYSVPPYMNEIEEVLPYLEKKSTPSGNRHLKTKSY